MKGERVRLITLNIRTREGKMVDIKQAALSIQRLQFGLRCVMASGGYKYNPGLSETELKKIAESTFNDVVLMALRVTAAEEVLATWGKEAEYRSVLDKLVEDLRVAMPTVKAEKGSES